MKSIITATPGIFPASGFVSDSRHTAEDDARLRREAERVRQQQMQRERRKHAEAEGRLAHAMARAAARSAPLSEAARSAQLSKAARSAPLSEAARSAQLSSAAQQPTAMTTALGMLQRTETTKVVDAALAENAQTSVEANTEEAQATLEARGQREQPAESSDPFRSLLQRLARGQSRGLLQDCAPLLEAIRARLGDRTLAGLGDGSERESLASAFDFLQGYADAATARVQGAEKIASLLIELRQQFEALYPDAAPASTVGAALVSQQLDLPSPGSVQAKAQARRTSTQRTPVDSARKTRSGLGEDAEEEDGNPLAASALAVAAGLGTGHGKVAAVAESSLDKDQRKRREDTLALATIRSI